MWLAKPKIKGNISSFPADKSAISPSTPCAGRHPYTYTGVHRVSEVASCKRVEHGTFDSVLRHETHRQTDLTAPLDKSKYRGIASSRFKEHRRLANCNCKLANTYAVVVALSC